MGLDGFEFVEFTGPDPHALADLFEKMGFTHVGTHKSKNVRRYAQGDINFLLNMDDAGQVAGFREAHGPSANAMAFRVADAAKGVEAGGRERRGRSQGRYGPGELDIPAIEGIGGANLYLVDARDRDDLRYRFQPTGKNAERQFGRADTLDHLTHNLNRGRMELLGGILREHLQLPRNPLFRYRRPVDRPVLQGDDRARQQDPHPPE